uniref:Strictosidine synthase conserved region domain-containing protein n=1 Tax=Chromera velia CCMP2878 TaxID=1169474 RepID=A0A0G4IBM5_9ALVE|mmetsp:Transcript_24566/g.48210  ORF Transcript_24566/g.48210 Transcript_24566/m.48210 type:complete len:409 (+) Transcript_24566:154-1380(+)|eukprot:Cvel_2220.t1-p1 / transcript=Cvel_2220.t1 / gene=Cvel_2220 / organism=Chromera_velia_CCMP2878 / gene_product=Adipocyte plasma membrane-associated protein, putative / transcript_product=Adipocyte plasma membrane-associated protein, putative / location=Cvel_scaffold85:134253-135476(+) / protein_length=408 / sequence_SO=supercontig / SO=protein_coding / is_pseudo=false
MWALHFGFGVVAPIVVALLTVIVKQRTPIDAQAKPSFVPLKVPEIELPSPEIVFEGKVVAGESFAEGPDGWMYVSGGDGVIWRFKEDLTAEPVARTGEPSVHCGRVKAMEPFCGRPLGLAFASDGALLICDAYKGLMKLDLDDESQPVGKDGLARPVVLASEASDGSPIRFCNSVLPVETETEGGGIEEVFFFTDTSEKWQRNEVLYEILEGAPKGRILQFRPSTGRAEILKSDLKFPNGLLKSPSANESEDALLMVELNSYSVWKFFHRGPRRGSWERVMEQMPCVPDNLSPGRSGPTATFFAGCAYKRKSAERIMAPTYVRQALAALFPMSAIEYVSKTFFDNRATVLEVREDGSPIAMYRAPKEAGGFIFCAEAVVWNGFVWLGTWFAPQSMARWRLEDFRFVDI